MQLTATDRSVMVFRNDKEYNGKKAENTCENACELYTEKTYAFTRSGTDCKDA